MELSDDDLRFAIEDNEAELFSTFRSLGDRVQLRRCHSGTFLSTPYKFWLFNGIFRARVHPTQIESTLDEWERYFHSREVPFGVFLYPHSTSTELEGALRSRNYVPHESTLIVFDSDELKTINLFDLDPLYHKIEIRDAKQFAAFSDCWSQIFDAPTNFGAAFIEWAIANGFNHESPLQNIAIMAGNKAVAIASYYLDSKLVGIYNVGVHPDYRRRGLGVQIALAIAKMAQKRGVRYMAGLGSAEGMQVYRKFKIREIGIAHRWVYSL